MKGEHDSMCWTDCTLLSSAPELVSRADAVLHGDFQIAVVVFQAYDGNSMRAYSPDFPILPLCVLLKTSSPFSISWLTLLGEYIFGNSFAIMSLLMSRYKLLHLFYKTSSENFILMKSLYLALFQ